MRKYMSMQWEHHTQGQVHICSASFNMLKRFCNGELEIRPFCFASDGQTLGKCVTHC
jgi:hypothetical protein